MLLRRLETRDAGAMLEWMHDESVVGKLKTNFKEKTYEDCLNFISAAADDSKHINLAIADDNGDYLGTISLRNIENGTAEFAITISKRAMGTGIAKEAMDEMINRGFSQYNLQMIYWCVFPENNRACRFYDKHHYTLMTSPPPSVQLRYSAEEMKRLIWYCIQKGNVCDC